MARSGKVLQGYYLHCAQGLSSNFYWINFVTLPDNSGPKLQAHLQLQPGRTIIELHTLRDDHHQASQVVRHYGAVGRFAAARSPVILPACHNIVAAVPRHLMSGLHMSALHTCV